MSRIEKLVQQFLNNPASLRFADIEKVLFHFGFIKIETKGSHKKFKNSHLSHDLVIPVHNNDCKDFYKKLAAKTLKKSFINN